MLKMRWLGGLLPAALVAACSLGDGNRPETMEIVPPGGDSSSTETAAYLCVPRLLALHVEFTDGEIGNFAPRALWTSDKPDVVAVANDQDTPIEGTEGDEQPRYYPAGTLIAKAPGTARITAEYIGLTDSIDVRATEAGALWIEPADIRIAPGTVVDYEIKALIEGVVTDVSDLVVLSLQADEEEYADILTLGEGSTRVIGRAPGGPFTLAADFPYCDRTAQTTTAVAVAESLVLEREEGFGENLIRDTTEAFTAWADFGSGPEQDVSTQVQWTSSDTNIADFGAGGAVFQLRGEKVGGVQVRASLGSTEEGAEQPRISSPELPVNVINGTLNSIRVEPQAATILPLASVQLHAIGSYNSGAHEQDIRRHVDWTSSDQDILFVGTGLSASAGLAVSRLDRADQVNVRATAESATEVQTDGARITIDPNAPPQSPGAD